MIGTIARMTSGELPGCVIVSGMPGAGKTTVTRLAARLLPRAARVGGTTSAS
jgi:adenylate kinase